MTDEDLVETLDELVTLVRRVAEALEALVKMKEIVEFGKRMEARKG